MAGTTDFAARIHSFKIEFKPYFGTAPVDGDQLVFTYLDTLLLYDKRGVITTGYILACLFVTNVDWTQTLHFLLRMVSPYCRQAKLKMEHSNCPWTAKV
jgi:hypothetical protein